MRVYNLCLSVGLQVKAIEEEEYCLIPMGGVLPKHPQRVLGIGGTAGMVHPSTGGLRGTQTDTKHVSLSPLDVALLL